METQRTPHPEVWRQQPTQHPQASLQVKPVDQRMAYRRNLLGIAEFRGANLTTNQK